MPPIVSAHFHFWQFLAVWCFFTASTGYMLWLCMQRPIPRTTPRLVRRGALEGRVAGAGLFAARTLHALSLQSWSMSHSPLRQGIPSIAKKTHELVPPARIHTHALHCRFAFSMGPNAP